MDTFDEAMINYNKLYELNADKKILELWIIRY